MVHINVSTYLHIDQTELDDGKTIPYYWKVRKQKMCSWSQTLKEDRVHLDKYKEVMILQSSFIFADECLCWYYFQLIQYHLPRKTKGKEMTQLITSWGWAVPSSSKAWLASHLTLPTIHNLKSNTLKILFQVEIFT